MIHFNPTLDRYPKHWESDIKISIVLLFTAYQTLRMPFTKSLVQIRVIHNIKPVSGIRSKRFRDSIQQIFSVQELKRNNSLLLKSLNKPC